TLTTPTLNSGSIVSYNGTGSSYTLKNYSYSNLTIVAGASTVYSLPANLTGITTLTITTGILYLGAYNITATTLVNNATLRLKGSETMTFTTMDVNSGTVEYIGNNTASTYTIKDFGSTDYYNLYINDANVTKSTFQLGAAMVIAGTLTISGGTYSANGQTTSVAGLATINGGTYLPSTATQTLSSGLTVSSGTFTGSSGNVDVNGPLTLSGGTYTAPSTTTYVYGNWIQSGTFSPGTGTIVLDGASNQSISATSAFNNLTITNASGATLSTAVSVGGTLTLTSGKIELGNYNLTMNSGSTLSGGSSSSFIYTGGTGQFKWANCAASTSRTFPIGHTNSASGYTPLVVTFNVGHTTDDFGVVAYNVVCNDGTRGGSAYTTAVVKTTWNITETTAGGSNVSIQFQWNGSDEGSTFNRASCQMAHYNGSTWDALGSLASASGSNPYTFTYSNYTGSFSPFGMNGGGGPLPVNFLYLNAKQVGDFGDISWATATEKNNDYFSIEKSFDTKSFVSIGKVYGAGNSQQIIHYSFSDSNLAEGTNYYRLKQVDYNGLYEYTPIKVINNTEWSKTNSFKLFPVPAVDVLNLELNSTANGIIHINILNQMGKVVSQLETFGNRGKNNIKVDIREIPSGIYFLFIESDNSVRHTHRLLINK
ncbi:MAG: T9SS type A sorting domain-containing protein, partial [Bacteroidia bacterium]